MNSLSQELKIESVLYRIGKYKRMLLQEDMMSKFPKNFIVSLNYQIGHSAAIVTSDSPEIHL